ncbi:MAG: NUDIX hydrolase [Chitinophagales bacterium]
MSNITKAAKQETKYQIYSVPIESFFEIAVSIDCVVFGMGKKELQVLLIQRGAAPYKGYWALPGDLVYPNEDLDKSADRILKDLTSIRDINFDQVHTFGAVDRHPLGRVLTVAYYAIVNIEEFDPRAASWAEKTTWHSVKNLPKLAFDHKDIIQYSYKKLKEGVVRFPLWKQVLPKKFTLSQIQSFYEVVLDRKFDKGNFRKKLDLFEFVKETNDFQINVSHRPSRLFVFDKKKYSDYEKIK